MDYPTKDYFKTQFYTPVLTTLGPKQFFARSLSFSALGHPTPAAAECAACRIEQEWH
jgi:hypothetical protein